MGYGTFGGGDVELHVSIQDDSDVETWKRCFKEASRMLFQATDGVVRFAKVYVYDSTHSDVADALLYGEGTGDSYYKRVHPTVVPFETLDPDAFDPGGVMVLAGNAINTPFTVVHEFGHYGFGLGDEYLGYDDEDELFFTQCTKLQQDVGKPPKDYEKTEHACIMGPNAGALSMTRIKADPNEPDGYKILRGWILEFCNEDNHDAANGSNHNAKHGSKSCAEVILAERSVQVATSVSVGDAPNFQDIDWFPTINEPLYNISVDSDLGLTDVPPGAIYEAARYATHFVSSPGRVSLVRFGQGPAHAAFDEVIGVNDALMRARDELLGERKRPPVRAAVLLSTGRETIAAPQAEVLAESGIRVFTVGVGKDRAGLQQLAQRTKGAYFQLTGESGPGSAAQLSQRLREQVTAIYDQLRYGAPILRASRDSLRRGPISVPVEEDSKALKLVFVHTPSSKVAPALRHLESGRVVELEEMLRQQSVTGGYLTLIVPEPEHGHWIVELPNQSLLPPELSLTAYSESNRIHVAVNGAHRLRRVGEEVRLQVVVRTPFPVIGLAKPVVRVAAPGAATPEEHPLEPQRDGIHLASFEVHASGVHDIEIDVRNEGEAIVAGFPSDASSEAPRVPLFRRTKTLQVHVA